MHYIGSIKGAALVTMKRMEGFKIEVKTDHNPRTST